MSVIKTISKIIFILLAVCAGAANAATITTTFNGASYQTIGLHFGAASTVDFQFVDGSADTIFQLFDADDNHLISNDDVDNNAPNPRITQNLAAGNYTLLVSYCCTGIEAVAGTATYTNTDGFNAGVYWTGGSATMSGVEAALIDQANGELAGTQFSVEVTSSALELDGTVPEPQSLALFALALAALTVTRRLQPRK